MSKMFVLDTNVLLHDPTCIYKFEDNDVVIPICCLEELDKFKSESTERGANARAISRLLNEFVETHGNLSDFIPMKTGGRIGIFSTNIDFNFNGLKNSYDNLIIAVAKYLSSFGEVELVSNDINMRIKAASLGLRASEYRNDLIDDAGIIGKPVELNVGIGIMLEIYNDLGASLDASMFDFECKPYENMPVIVKCMDSGKQSALCLWKNGRLVRFKQRDIVSGISTKGSEQAFLMNFLVDPEYDLVVVAGEAGSGKTLLSLAAGLDSVRTNKKIDRVLFTKSIVPVGDDIGYVPGTKEEKMAEWVKPMHDNMELIMKKTGGKAADAFKSGDIEIDALTYIRGRSLMNRFVIIDEVQNLTPKMMRTIVTRIGEGAKLVLLGDLTQIDSPYLNSKNNGLIHVLSNMCGLSNVGILRMFKTQRSRLAQQAIERL